MRDVFSAVADPTRREIIHILSGVDELPLHEIVARFPMGRTAVAKHLRVLSEADIVRERKIGRETRFRFNPEPLQEIQEWVSFYEQFWVAQLDQLKQMLENENE